MLQLQSEFWPEGLDKSPQLDRTQPFLVQELKNGSHRIINGNHRRSLFLSTPGGPSVWPCRVIPKEEVILIKKNRRGASSFFFQKNGNFNP